jgi:hypothetical protein
VDTSYAAAKNRRRKKTKQKDKLKGAAMVRLRSSVHLQSGLIPPSFQSQRRDSASRN